MKELLPIGSIVELDHTRTPSMIVGYCPLDPQSQCVRDYLAVNCTFGFGTSVDMLMFDRKEIHAVRFSGYQDTQAQWFLTELEKMKLTERNCDQNREGV